MAAATVEMAAVVVKEVATTAVGSVKAAVEVVTAAARGGWGATGRRGGG
jgi:hypothetical protein